MIYRTKGTCSSAIEIEIENGKISFCKFTGGCTGNTQGLARMVIGRDARDVMEQLRGIPCRGGTSCPDQLSHAIEQYLSKE